MRIPPFCRQAAMASRLAVLFGLLFAQTVLGQTGPAGFVVTPVAEDLSRGAVGLSLLPDGRILVIHHQSGRVELVVNGVLKPEPILEVDSLVYSSEQGLLGIALDPDFPDSNYVYLFHSQSDTTNQVARYTLEGELTDAGSDQLHIDKASKKKLLSVPDTTRFHNGGTLRFGSDKTLYVSFGDDAQANRVQSLTNLYGKIVRIKRDGSIPVDNPVFPDEPATRRGEIFAMGLRNPFRFSIDPLTDELFIGDVGTDLYEELDLATGGENFGYPRYEGPGFFRENEQLLLPDPTFPAYTYRQTTTGRAALPLDVYRPKAYPADLSFPEAFHGVYFFADFFDDTLQYLLKDDAGSISQHAFGEDYSQLVDGAVDGDGGLYLLSYRGYLLKIDYNPDAVVANEVAKRPARFTLHQNYPNPFQGSSTISYVLERAEHVKIEVFDILGRRVALLQDAWQTPGPHVQVFEADHLPGGLYLLQLHAGLAREAMTMTVLGK